MDVAERAAAGTRRVYVEGSNPAVRVPVRAVILTNGDTTTLYATRGPYGQPGVVNDVRSGLAPLRQSWIEARNDTAELDHPTFEKFDLSSLRTGMMAGAP